MNRTEKLETLTGVKELVAQKRLIRLSSDEIPVEVRYDKEDKGRHPCIYSDGLSEQGIITRADELTTLSQINFHFNYDDLVTHFIPNGRRDTPLHKRCLISYNPAESFSFHHSFKCRRFVLGKDLPKDETDIAPPIHIDGLVARGIVNVKPYSQSQTKAYLNVIRTVFGEIPDRKKEKEITAKNGVESTKLMQDLRRIVKRAGIDIQLSKTHRGCYISTACVEAANLPDDCLELQTLREFRDGYVSQLPNGGKLIGKYYGTAPTIVTAIQAKPNVHDIFARIFEDDITTATRLIQRGDYDAALAHYMEMTERLEDKHLN